MSNTNNGLIMGIGTDMVSITRIGKILEKYEASFAKRILTQKENQQAKENKSKNYLKFVRFCAKRFAAKEALSKAAGLGIGRGINFNDIEISNNNYGKPEINLLNKKDVFLKEHLNCQKFYIHLSIADDLNMATATVIIEKSL